MSHFTSEKLPISAKNTEQLLEALRELFGKDAVEVHDKPVHLYGYGGDRREQTAHIVIRRHKTGAAASNDLGFLREGKHYTAIISDYDKTALRSKMNRLPQLYGQKVFETKLPRGMMRVKSSNESTEGTRIRLQVMR